MLAVSTLAIVGCGKGPAPETTSLNQKIAPGETTEFQDAEKVTRDFLSAMLRGDDAKLRSLLTPLARAKGEEQGIPFSPPASDTASFTINSIDTQGDQGAYVTSTLVDKNPDGENESAEIIWVVAKTNEGWRIAGAAVSLFEGMPPTIINFEDPEAAKKAIADTEADATRAARKASTMPNRQ